MSEWWEAAPIVKQTPNGAGDAGGKGWWEAAPIVGKDKSGGVSVKEADLSWYDVGKQALGNVPSSAARFAGDIVQPIIHPIDTAVGLKNIGQGVVEKTGITGSHEHEKYADAVGQFLKDRYGGVEALKHTLATDPVGFAADMSAVLSGGGGLAARAPGMAGRAGEIAGRVGEIVDPLKAAGKAAKGIGSVVGEGAAQAIGNFGTHTGADSVKLAASSGFEGGQAGAAFRDNMRRDAPMGDTVEYARNAVRQMRQERGSEYRDGMADVAQDQTVLTLGPIHQAIVDMERVKNFKGQSLSPSTMDIRRRITEAVDAWQQLDPKEFHTVEGLDALKQQIGDIRDSTEHGTPERLVADHIYNAVRSTITSQAPEYARVMEGYAEASDIISEIERTLSTNPKASIDTALRKLQSVLRDNVSSNYGNRKVLAQYLVDHGAPNLLERLAGQQMSSWTPRGLGKLGGQLSGVLAGAEFGWKGVAGLGLAAPLTSPRLVGEVAHAGGRVAGAVSRGIDRAPEGTGKAMYQAGRSSQLGKAEHVNSIEDGEKLPTGTYFMTPDHQIHVSHGPMEGEPRPLTVHAK